MHQVFGKVKESSRQQLKIEVCNIYNMKKDIMENFTNLDNLGNCKTKLDLLEDQIYHHLKQDQNKIMNKELENTRHVKGKSASVFTVRDEVLG